jgi:hemolysin activation/secretion protein
MTRSIWITGTAVTLVAVTVAAFAANMRPASPFRVERDDEIDQMRDKAFEQRRKELEKKRAELEPQLSLIDLPVDETPLIKVREITITGNTLISTEEIFADMPLIWNAAAGPVTGAKSEHLYDFRVVHEIILDPGTVREISARAIQGLTQYILSVYQKRHYAGIYVYVPATAIAEDRSLPDDTLQVKVLEAPVSDVNVTMYDPNQTVVAEGYLDVNALLSWSPVRQGLVANRKKLDDFVNLLNRNPDRHVRAVISSGAEPNTLGVNYQVYETNPWHWFVLFDNSGTRQRQWDPKIGVINTNLLGYDDSFMTVFQLPIDSAVSDNYSLYGRYDVPVLSQKLRFGVFGGYSEYDLQGDGPWDFLGGGKYIGGRLKYNLLQHDGWFFDIAGTLTHEESKISPELAGGSVTFLRSDVEMDIWTIEADISRRDDMSYTRLLLRRSESFDGSDRAEFTTARSGADPDFAIYSASLVYSRQIDPNKVQRLNANYRFVWPNERLVPAKMTAFGGLYSVRGYSEYDTIADGGHLFSFEYEYDLMRYYRVLGLQPFGPENEDKNNQLRLKKVAPLAFLDYGRAEYKDPQGAEPDHVTLISVGPGIRTEIGDHFSGAVYFGFPLKETDNTKRNRMRVDATLMLRW